MLSEIERSVVVMMVMVMVMVLAVVVMVVMVVVMVSNADGAPGRKARNVPLSAPLAVEPRPLNYVINFLCLFQVFTYYL